MKKPVSPIDKTGHNNQFYYTVSQTCTQKEKNIRGNHMEADR
jgi:hypothetical protein